MPDYEQAKTAADNQGVWHGKNSAGENVMAMTVIMRRDNTVLGAVRFVVSLSQVDIQIRILILVMVLIGVAIIFFVMLSSSYFISTIVNPVTEIGRAARRIALKRNTTMRSASCAIPSTTWPEKSQRPSA